MQSLLIDAGYAPAFHACPEMETLLLPTEEAQLGAPPGGGAAGTEAWQQLLESQYHKQALISGRLPDCLSSAAELFPCPPAHAPGVTPLAHPPTCPPADPPGAGVVTCKGAGVGIPPVFGSGWMRNKWRGGGGDGEGGLVGCLERLTAALHCLHEDLKLNVLMHSTLPTLARMLLLLSHALGARTLSDYYIRYHPELAQLLYVFSSRGGGGVRVEGLGLRVFLVGCVGFRNGHLFRC
jgi:hypothetical protein